MQGLARLRTVLLVALSTAVVATCQTGPSDPSQSEEPLAVSENGPVAPPGPAVRFGQATLNGDRSALTLEFIGGREFDRADPCSNHYFGWAHESNGVLEAKIVDDTPQALAPGTPVACDAVGHTRRVQVQLAEPFDGTRVQDLAGGVHFVRAPDGLAELTGLPPGWTLVRESNVQESPTGRWQRTWTRDGGSAALGSSKDTIDLYQAFDGPADVTGGDERRQIEVNGGPGVLYRYAPAGELVLVWKLEDDGFALVVNESDFPVEAAIKLAESVVAR